MAKRDKFKQGEVVFFRDEVLAAVAETQEEALTMLALQCEAHIKTLMPSAKPGFDTGFMRNAVYAIFPDGADRRGETWSDGSYTSDDTGHSQHRAKAERPQVPSGASAVHAAAEYTIYWEDDLHFMHKGLQKMKAQAGQIVKQAGQGTGL